MASGRQTRIVIEQLEDLTEKAIRLIVLEMTAELTEATPADTGWARANWIPAVTVADLQARPNSGQPSAAESLKQAGIAQVLEYRLNKGPLFISNNVPYITRLNAGSSTQAPVNFVPSAIERGLIKGARKLRA